MCCKYHDILEANQSEKASDLLSQFIQPQNISNFDSLKAELNIVRTNRVRKIINNEMMLAKKSQLKEGDYTFVESEEKETSQDMYLYEGLPVISTSTTYQKSYKPKKAHPAIARLQKTIQSKLNKIFKQKSVKSKKFAFHNNEMFVVHQIKNNTIFLKTRILNSDTKVRRLTVTLDEFKQFFIPAYAITTYKIEGATLDIPHSIWEFNRMTHKSRYTALTRTKDSKLVSIYNLTHIPTSLNNSFSGYDCRIYKITSEWGDYVGSTRKHLSKRFSEHVLKSQTGNSKLYRCMRKNGTDNFKIELIHEFKAKNYKHQLEVEHDYIILHDTINNGLNIQLRT
jgi:hypothetical protein